MKNERGITLIALVITVILLLILAGVAVSMITGEDGLFSKANTAGYTYIKSTEEEAIKVAMWNLTLNAYTNTEDTITASSIEAELRAKGNDITVTEEGENFVISFNKTRNQYKVNRTGDIEEASNNGEKVLFLNVVWDYIDNKKNAEIKVNVQPEIEGNLIVMIDGQQASYSEIDGTYNKIVNTNKTYTITAIQDELGLIAEKSVKITGLSWYVTVEKETEIETVTKSDYVIKGENMTLEATVSNIDTFMKWFVLSGTCTLENQMASTTTITPQSDVTIRACAGVPEWDVGDQFTSFSWNSNGPTKNDKYFTYCFHFNTLSIV